MHHPLRLRDSSVNDSRSQQRSSVGHGLKRCSTVRIPVRSGLLGLLLLLVVAVYSAATAARAADGVAAEDSTLTVGVSIPPLAYLIEQIGKDRVNVVVLLPEGRDPHAYTPALTTLRDLSQAQVFFSSGLISEQHWVDKLTSLLPDLPVYTLSELQHFWLSPQEVLSAIELITLALTSADPQGQQFFSSNAKHFADDVEKLNLELTALFRGVGDANHFLVVHPAWELFARDYALEQIIVEQGRNTLSVRSMFKLVQQAKRLGLDTLYSEVTHPSKDALSIAEQLDANIILLNPLSSDWKTNLRLAAEAIKAGLR